jgi:hypothetical protein
MTASVAENAAGTGERRCNTCGDEQGLHSGLAEKDTAYKVISPARGMR